MATTTTPEENSELIEIDGSYAEGGGQLCRNSVALAAILCKPVWIRYIRAGRETPGLRAQHLTGIQLVAWELLQDKTCLSQCQVGSQSVQLIPKQKLQIASNSAFLADTQTAGSCTLLLQTCLPCLLFGTAPSAVDGKVHVTLKGGTNVSHSPPVDELIHILKPLVETHFGAHFDITIKRRGYFPKGTTIVTIYKIGGGVLEIDVPVPKETYLKPIQLVKRGAFTKVEVSCFTSCTTSVARKHMNDVFDAAYSNSMFEAVKKLVQESLGAQVEVVLKQVTHDACGSINGAILTLALHTDTNCMFGASGGYVPGIKSKDAGKKKKSKKKSQEDKNKKEELVMKPEFLANQAWNTMLSNMQLKSASCVDEYVQDQLIIFMALAKGKSAIRCAKPLTQHTIAAIYVCELLTGVKFIQTEDATSVLLECEGIAFARGGAQ